MVVRATLAIANLKYGMAMELHYCCLPEILLRFVAFLFSR